MRAGAWNRNVNTVFLCLAAVLTPRQAWSVCSSTRRPRYGGRVHIVVDERLRGLVPIDSSMAARVHGVLVTRPGTKLPLRAQYCYCLRVLLARETLVIGC
jgi:predicted small integral membrane protein